MTGGCRIARALALLGTAAMISACGSMPGPSPLMTGMWGGDHIALTVGDASVHAEFDCAHGDIPSSVTVNDRGGFDVSGTFVRERGGPIREGELPDSHPAAYVGSVTGTTMMLTVRLTDTNEIIGTFTLTRGSPGLVVKCLLPALRQQRVVPTLQRENTYRFRVVFEADGQLHGVAAHASGVSRTRETGVAVAPHAAVFGGIRSLRREVAGSIQDDSTVDLASGAVELEQRPGAVHDHPYVVASP